MADSVSGLTTEITYLCKMPPVQGNEPGLDQLAARGWVGRNIAASWQTVALASAFGVSRQAGWRDLQQILYGPREYNFYSNGEFRFTVYRAYPGGPVVSVTDPEGN